MEGCLTYGAGVLSMIFYSLILVVSCKYLMLLCYVEGPGGTGGSLALLRALTQRMPNASSLLVPAGLLAISLFLADSLITPGVSVLSAVEGLQSLVPGIMPFCPIIAIIILSVLFYSQRYGPGSLVRVDGPSLIARPSHSLLRGLSLGPSWSCFSCRLGRWG